jgi:hypothetical protein
LVAASPAIAASNIDAQLDSALDNARRSANTAAQSSSVTHGFPIDEMSVLVHDTYADDEAVVGMY